MFGGGYFGGGYFAGGYFGGKKPAKARAGAIRVLLSQDPTAKAPVLQTHFSTGSLLPAGVPVEEQDDLRVLLPGQPLPKDMADELARERERLARLVLDDEDVLMLICS